MLDPIGRLDVITVATPPDTVPEPREVTPRKKFTVPVGLDPVTVAVRVTLAPDADGFGDEDTDVVVAERTRCVSVSDDGEFCPFPEYTAPNV